MPRPAAHTPAGTPLYRVATFACYHAANVAADALRLAAGGDVRVWPSDDPATCWVVSSAPTHAAL